MGSRGNSGWGTLMEEMKRRNEMGDLETVDDEGRGLSTLLQGERSENAG